MVSNLSDFIRQQEVFEKDNLSKEGQREQFQESVRDFQNEVVFREWRNAFGRIPGHDRYIDGNLREPIKEADFSGRWELSLKIQAARRAYELVKQFAKVRTEPPGLINGHGPGRLKRSVTMEINSAPATLAALENSSPSDEILIYLNIPYAGVGERAGWNRVEGGIPRVTKGRGRRIGGRGLLASVSAIVTREFKSQGVEALFTYLNIPSTGIPDGRAPVIEIRRLLN
jgi:hypothetical protein